MSGWKMILVWVGCVIVGAAVGFGIGWALWKLGFEIIGSAVALVGAGIGGFVVLFAVMRWSEEREYRSGR
jgi:Zn-dependent protease with chaperone function